MEVKVKQVTSWERAYEAALSTVGKRPIKGVTDEWKDKMLMAEHSPIRLVEYDIYLYGIPSFVATHLVRHHIGCEKFVVTNREDRRNVNPEEINRLTPVDMMITCNAQSLINISRKRLCTCASKETREVWQAVKNAIAEIDPIMAKHMVRECEYRNMCSEIKGCGYYVLKKRKECLVLDIDWMKKTHGINLSLPEIEMLDEQINELNKK
jgi:thymidylate synthase ThyX